MNFRSRRSTSSPFQSSFFALDEAENAYVLSGICDSFLLLGKRRLLGAILRPHLHYGVFRLCDTAIGKCDDCRKAATLAVNSLDRVG